MSAELPLGALGLLLLADGALCALRSRGREHSPWLRACCWALRPLEAWAAVNAYFRLQPWSAFKINPGTFPLYANSWPEGPDASAWTRAAGALLVILVALVILRRALAPGGRRNFWAAALWIALAGAQLAISLAPEGWEGVLLPWTDHSTVYVYAARSVEDPVLFVRDFTSVQPTLALHGRTHPPGATLLSYWTQDLVDPAVPWNVIGLLLLANLNVLVLYLLGLKILPAPRGAVTAAALAGAMPAAVAYHTFSLDPVYSVLFSLYLLLTWKTSQGRNVPAWSAAGGGVLFLLSMMTFSWSIVALAAALFLFLGNLRKGRTPARSIFLAGLPPLAALMPHLALRAWGFDYLTAYRQAYAYHIRFYRFDNAHDWWIALIGGQVEFLLGAGPLAAAAFVVYCRKDLIRRDGDGLALLTGCVLFAYSLPLLLGPNPLKMETARSWYWVYTVVVLAAGKVLLGEGSAGPRLVLLAAALSLGCALGLNLFLNFGA